MIPGPWNLRPRLAPLRWRRRRGDAACLASAAAPAALAGSGRVPARDPQTQRPCWAGPSQRSHSCKCRTSSRNTRSPSPLRQNGALQLGLRHNGVGIDDEVRGSRHDHGASAATCCLCPSSLARATGKRGGGSQEGSRLQVRPRGGQEGGEAVRTAAARRAKRNTGKTGEPKRLQIDDDMGQ